MLAVTWPCLAPRRTNEASPRPPMARVKASSRIDFPAPVSPVSTQSPGPNSRSSLSIRTMSRIDKADSMMRVRLGLGNDAELIIGLSQSAQGLFDLCRGLVVGHHDFEAIDGGKKIVMAQIEAADLHLA